MHKYIFYLGHTMDLLLDAIQFQKDEKLDEVFFDSDMDLYGSESSPGLHKEESYLELLHEAWCQAFEQCDQRWDDVRKPAMSLYKLKREVRRFRNEYEYGNEMHRETGKCCAEVILMSLLFFTKTVEKDDQFVKNMVQYLRAQYQMWKGKKDTDIRKSMLNKFCRYNKVIKKNLGEIIID